MPRTENTAFKNGKARWVEIEHDKSSQAWNALQTWNVFKDINVCKSSDALKAANISESH
jgi:hypothetical protein